MSKSNADNDERSTQDSHVPLESAGGLEAGLAAAFQSDNRESLAATTAPTGSSFSVGDLLNGRYRLIQAIGEGGMGTVWLAEQKEPVKRKVAVKLVKAGMDSRQVLARFEAERQALAMMDHPNIAKVLDGGMTEQGRPYFVMELVKGIPVTEYCDQVRFLIRERLELFGQVCSAVQHAHQKGIIHRDLKPSNVLVTEVDGRPIVKVIDFGLAKALHGSQVLSTMNNMANFLYEEGKYEPLVDLLETVRGYKATLGDGNKDTLLAMSNLGMAYQAVGDTHLAVRVTQEVLQKMRIKLGVDHPTTLQTLNGLGAMLWSTKEYEKASEILPKYFPSSGRF